MKRPPAVLVSIAAAGLAGGCFFVDPINERPGSRIRWEAVDLYRGSTLHLDADIDDPDGETAAAHWTVRACGGARCAPAVVRLDEDGNGAYAWQYVIPEVVDGDDPMAPLVDRVEVTLDAVDRWGARARPPDDRTFLLLDRAPVAQPVIASWRGVASESFPVDVPITLRVPFEATSAANTITVTATVKREGATVPSAPLIAGPATASWAEYTLRPATTGQWLVAFTLTDRAEETATVEKALRIDADQHPCIASAVPLFGGPIVVDTARRFTVLSVRDDKDPYPAVEVDDDVMDVAHFRWSMSSPADPATFVAIEGHDGPDLLLDPARFAPGDVFDVRVDALDRVAREACDPSNRQCSQREDGCTRRLTWTVEIR